jgi:hypothetical protein
MKKFLLAHYEKMILAALLIIFAALLYYQLLFVQRAQNQDVAAKVNPVQMPSDYQSIDFTDKKFRMESIFSEWNRVPSNEPSPTKTRLMTPYPLAECVFCHALIPANAYPAIGETKNGKCPACGKALVPRVNLESDVVLGKADQNNNGIPDEWEKEYNITAANSAADSDEDTDGFTLLQEYKAKTNPTDPLSHPKYLSQVYVSAVSRQRFTGLELVSVDMTKPDKKDWTATFNVIRNNRKRSDFVQINVSTFTSNNVSFSVTDIEVDEKTQEPIVYIQRVGKIERIVCRPKQNVYDPAPRVRFLNALYDRTFTSSVGADFKLGTARTGEELYTVVSADPTTKEVVVKISDASVDGSGGSGETFKILPVPKELSASDTTIKSSTSQSGTKKTTEDSSPFLQKQ